MPRPQFREAGNHTGLCFDALDVRDRVDKHTAMGSCRTGHGISRAGNPSAQKGRYHSESEGGPTVDPGHLAKSVAAYCRTRNKQEHLSRVWSGGLCLKVKDVQSF